jgi:hypothetical protein
MNKVLSNRLDKNILFKFLCFLLFLWVVSPLLIFKYPILIDYPNHLASYFIQANIDHDPWLKENYRVVWNSSHT